MVVVHGQWTGLYHSLGLSGRGKSEGASEYGFGKEKLSETFHWS